MVTSLEKIEKELLNKKMKTTYLYHRMICFYDFDDFVIGNIDTRNFGKQMFIDYKENLRKVLYQLLHEDLQAEVNKFNI